MDILFHKIAFIMIHPNLLKGKIHKPTIFRLLSYLVKDHFPQFSVNYDETTLYISGTLKDEDWGSDYQFLISTSVNGLPSAFIINPTINPQPSIHMYSNRALCLFHRKDLPRHYYFSFVGDIIPWVIKWVHYYEIWLRNGNHWLGPETPHF
jgi:hypothetical protein